jgi:NhaC family Na+:H+ antiporter
MAQSSQPSAGAEADAPSPPARRQPHPPSLLDAILPIVVLIGLLALTIVFFGIDATNGPLQVALLLSAAFASLIAFRTAHRRASATTVGA